MPEFSYTDLLPVGADSTQYRYTDLLPVGADSTQYLRVSDGGITSRRSFGREFIEIEPGVLSLLTEYQETKAILRPQPMLAFLAEKIRSARPRARPITWPSWSAGTGSRC